MDWLSAFLGLFGSGSGGGSGGGGVSSFSTSTSAQGRTGNILQDFGNAPVYKQSALSVLQKTDPVKLAIGAVAVVLVVAIWRKTR